MIVRHGAAQVIAFWDGRSLVTCLTKDITKLLTSYWKKPAGKTMAVRVVIRNVQIVWCIAAMNQLRQ